MATKDKTGARALKSILYNVLKDIKFNLPDFEDDIVTGSYGFFFYLPYKLA
jgi:ATP-dependent protease Clp ATPase subunit